MEPLQPEDLNNQKPTEEVLTSLSRKLTAEYQRERGRVAKELRHESDQAALCIAELTAMRSLVPDSAGELRTHTDKIRNEAERLFNSLRSTAQELYSPTLEYLGVSKAMRSACREFSERYSLPVNFTQADLPSTIPEEISICLFRVLQGALDNVSKHGGARSVEVKLQASPELRLSIQISGIDFDPATMDDDGPSHISIRERVYAMGGSFSMASKPFGTEIDVCVPLP